MTDLTGEKALIIATRLAKKFAKECDNELVGICKEAKFSTSMMSILYCIAFFYDEFIKPEGHKLDDFLEEINRNVNSILKGIT